MALLSVENALNRIVADAPLTEMEEVSLLEADGRVLAQPLVAQRQQPPFAASAMDGYAVRAADLVPLPAKLLVAGQAAAGHAFTGSVKPGEAVRIFTGAPVPEGTDAIVLQEDATRDGGSVIVQQGQPDRAHIRHAGLDFARGAVLLRPPLVFGPRQITLAAAMGHARVPVRRRPKVAILATGDELVLPGEVLAPDQIVCSNPYGVSAIAARAGAAPRLLGIARDTPEHLAVKIEEAADADILVTIGGASVGDHDLVAPVLQRRGLELAFWKIAMRPGKPLMFGRLGRTHVLGLPGNPVSSLICAHVFLVPLIRSMLGLAHAAARAVSARLAAPLEANGPRTHYMRAVLGQSASGGSALVTPVRSQDSSLLSPLAEANVLIVRHAHAPALPAKAAIEVTPLDF